MMNPRNIRTRPGAVDRRSHPLLLRTTRNRRTTPGETFVIVTAIEIQSVVLQYHHLVHALVKLFQMGGFRFELGHGKVQRLVGLVSAQQYVTGRLLQQHWHILLPLAFPVSEINRVVVGVDRFFRV